MKKNKELRYDKVSTYLYINKKSLIISSITGVIFNGLTVLVPIFQGYLLNEYMNQKDPLMILYFALSFLLFVIFVQINRFLKRFYVRDFANRMTLTLRKVSFENLINMDIEEFNNTSKGDIISKNLSDIKDSSEGVRKVITEIYDSVILLTGYLISLLIMDYKITLITLIFIVFSILFAELMKKVIYKSTLEYKKAFSSNKDITLNVIENELYYRGMGVNQNYYNKYKDSLDNLEKKSIKSMIFKGSFEPLYKLIALLGIFFVIYFGSKNVLNNVWEIGIFYSFLSSYVLVSQKASKVGKVFNAITAFKVSWNRCLVFLHPLIKKDEINLESNSNNTLLVKDLTFGFDESFKVKNISFNLKSNDTLFIMGKVHSGKSTLGAALSGIYDYKGSIKLNDLELKEFRNDLIPNFIGYSSSNIEIYNDTLSFNVSLKDNENVSKELKLVYLDKFINNQNKILNHSSSELSGGEKKRLSIARSLYLNPKVIILDDPFNAIDLNMSKNIINNIKSNYKDSILIIISNQKELINNDDKVLFLNNDTYLFNDFKSLKNNQEFKEFIGESYESI